MKVIDGKVHFNTEGVALASDEAWEVSEKLIPLAYAARNQYDGEFVATKSLKEGDKLIHEIVDYDNYIHQSIITVTRVDEDGIVGRDYEQFYHTFLFEKNKLMFKIKE